MSGELEPMKRAEMRASHEDRDSIVDQLRVAAGDGRIDADELDQRIEAALNARTYGELDVLIRDLPPAPVTTTSTVRHTTTEVSQSINIAHGNAHRQGPWVVPQQLHIELRHGNVLLDFTEAVFPGVREIEVSVNARHSNLRMIVPEGTVIDTSGLAMRHGNVHQRELGTATPQSIRITVSGEVAHSNVRVALLSRFAQRRRARRAARALPRG